MWRLPSCPFSFHHQLPFPHFLNPLIFILSSIPSLKRQSSSAPLLYPRSLFSPSHPPFLCSLFFAYFLSFFFSFFLSFFLSFTLFLPFLPLVLFFFLPSFHSFESSVACHHKVKKKGMAAKLRHKTSLFFQQFIFLGRGRKREGGRLVARSLSYYRSFSNRPQKKDGAFFFYSFFLFLP